MSPERWQQVDRLFEVALGLQAAERSAWLDAACGSDEALRHKVVELLEAEDEMRGFLAQPLDRNAVGQVLGRIALGERSRIGPYRLLRVLAYGGMATVYLGVRARDPGRRKVAIKLCRHSLATPEFRRRFRNEHRILARLDHHHIASFDDGGTTEDGLPYLVMEYVEGTPIDRYGDRHALSVEHRLMLFRQLCSGVHHAHQHQLVHRDIKPGNVLVTAAGRVKLLDFGIAKLLDPQRFALSAEPTQTGIHLLTPGYASPEQIRNEAITPASDVYSLGVLLFKLLSGCSPYRVAGHSLPAIERAVCGHKSQTMGAALRRLRFQGRNPTQVSRARGFQRSGQLRRRLQGDLEAIVVMALGKQPESRYRSVAAFADDVRHHLLGRPILARPRRCRVGPLLRRRRGWRPSGSPAAAVISSP